ncbi:hypothetical protein C8F04DRAFT_1243593 [Mycena alexandri]|uniref:Uncharacterized protein n=1 Tax=Mycena alexandri TaxID=1745969 RepID=A0AAD6RZ33_9AGAR|nr:hypothetical protein C8F04DRAFT_1243593 [Mycena alexandri]
MSDALPCPVTNIVLDKTEWKPQTPMNRGFLPLGGTSGFGAMKKQMKKSKDKTLIVVMPGHRKPADNLPARFLLWIYFWDMKGDNNVGGGAGEAGPSNAVAKEEDKTFDFSQLETSTEDSVGQQKLTFDQAIASHLEELQDRWPVNEAGQRIYTDDKGFKWDLTPIRLNVWAAHKARGTATVDKPPTSAQFDIKNRIKIQPVPSVPVTVQPVPPPAAAPVTAVTDQILALALSMLQQQQHQPVPMPIVPVTPVQPPSNPIPDPSPVPSAPPSPAKHLHRPVSLLVFCTHYEIPQYMERLEKLEYEPGDKGIKSLTREEWQTFAGFGKLAWNKVLSKHQQFLDDVRAGFWEH